MNNLSDVGSSAGMIFGAKAAAKPADREHPYGHARLEYIAVSYTHLMYPNTGVSPVDLSVFKG